MSLETMHKTDNEFPDKAELYQKYWERFRALLRQEGKPLDFHLPDWHQDYLLIGSRPRLDRFGYVVKANHSWIEYGIESKDSERTRAIFEYLQENKAAIESDFGAELKWELKPGSKRARVRYLMESGILSQEQEMWPAQQRNLIRVMVKFRNAIQPFLDFES